jgi:hypothetical protein
MHLDEETQASKSALALKDKLQPLEAELVRIEATAYEVKLEAEHGRERESAHRDQSGSPFDFAPQIENSQTFSDMICSFFDV